MANTTVTWGAANDQRYYSLAGFTLPNADWCIGCWFRPAALDSNNVLIGGGDRNLSNSIALEIRSGGDIGFNVISGNNESTILDPFIIDWATEGSTNYLAVMQRRGANLQAFVYAKGSTISSAKMQAAHGQTATCAPATIWIGGNSLLDDPDLERLWNGPMGEVFVLLNDSLSNTELTTLCAGAHITAVRATRALDLRFRTVSTTEPDLSGNGRDATQVGTGWDTATEFFADGTAAAALSAASPSGTLGTQTTATIGATTDQNSGTFYVVVDSAANLSGVTASQIKAGNHAGGSAAVASANIAVSTTSPSVGVTGLTAGTLYSYAAVQNNANGDSNVVTGTFTTASAVAASGQPGKSSGARIAALMHL